MAVCPAGSLTAAKFLCTNAAAASNYYATMDMARIINTNYIPIKQSLSDGNNYPTTRLLDYTNNLLLLATTNGTYVSLYDALQFSNVLQC